jgi:hypothetical protein
MGHRSVKSTLRYQACILPSVTSPLDPESQEILARHRGLPYVRASLPAAFTAARRSLGEDLGP